MYSRNIMMNETREVLQAMQTEVKVVEYSEEGVRGKGLDGGHVMILRRDAHRKARQIRNVFFFFELAESGSTRDDGKDVQLRVCHVLFALPRMPVLVLFWCHSRQFLNS